MAPSLERWRRLLTRLRLLISLAVETSTAEAMATHLSRRFGICMEAIQRPRETIRSSTRFLEDPQTCWCLEIKRYGNHAGRFRECLDCGNRWMVQIIDNPRTSWPVEIWTPTVPRSAPGGPLGPQAAVNNRELCPYTEEQRKADQ